MLVSGNSMSEWFSLWC